MWASRETQGLNRITTQEVVGFLLSDANTTVAALLMPVKRLKWMNPASANVVGAKGFAGKTSGKAICWKYVDV